MANFGSTIQFSDTDRVIMGVLVSKEQTKNYSGGRRGYYIFRYDFQYVVSAARYDGTSYGRDVGVITGMQVPVAYVPDNPKLARIKGMSSGPFIRTGFWLQVGATLVTVAGSACLFSGLRKARKDSFLLANGVLTTGTVIGKVCTGVTIDGKTEYEVQFQFKHQKGQTCLAPVKTCELDLLATPLKRVIYNATNPSNATLVELLPPDLRVLI